jgi:hypothetical protein
MELIFPSHMVWWLTVIDIPVATALFAMIWRNKKEADQAIGNLSRLLETRSAQLRDSLSAYKLEVAKTYSTQREMRELEERLVSHLLRIESKLDKQIEREIIHGND